jgi:four helix bundle protein
MQRKPIRRFEDLLVWQKGIALVKEVYIATSDGALRRDFGLRDQIRAAVSNPTNIAEGFERSSRKEYLLFLNIAKGLAGEMRSLIRVAFEVGYFDKHSAIGYANKRELSVATFSIKLLQFEAHQLD